MAIMNPSPSMLKPLHTKIVLLLIFSQYSFAFTCSQNLPRTRNNVSIGRRSHHSLSCLSPSKPTDSSSETTAKFILEETKETDTLSNAIIRISFDGSRFTGWSAANTQENDKLQRPSKRRRRRGDMGEIPKNKAGFVRSVEGVIRDNLAKIYGNVNPRRIIVEGCSRTDRGVHATGMIAQIYCLKEDIFNSLNDNEESEESINLIIPGKRIPHPTSPTDTSYFEPIPMNGNLSRLAFALNRMRPADVQVTGIAPTPISSSCTNLPFHASISSKSKTYEYRISIGDFQDPTMRRLAWYIPGNHFDVDKVKLGCKILEGEHDFTAFQGSPRGAGDKKKRLEQKDRSTICVLHKIDISIEDPPVDDVYFPGVFLESYKITVKGDRFLYKMSRFLVGALVAVGTGVLELEDLERALITRNWNIPGQEDHRKQFTCAPAHGLVLKNVDYQDLLIDWQPLRF